MFEIATQKDWKLSFKPHAKKSAAQHITFGHGDLYVQTAGLHIIYESLVTLNIGMQGALKHQSSGPPLIGYRFIWIFRKVIPGQYLTGKFLSANCNY